MEKEIMAKDKRTYFFVSQEVREGDRSYLTRWCECRDGSTTIEDVEDENMVKHDCGVDADDMEIYTEDPYVRVMTKEEYEVVSRFI